MPQGINGDLADITVYTALTPVHFTSSNTPLSELDANILVLDTKLEGWIESGSVMLSEAGDGNLSYPVVLTTTANATPRLTFGMTNLTCFAVCDFIVAASAVTTSGFNLNIKISGSGGAWTGKLDWVSDGR